MKVRKTIHAKLVLDRHNKLSAVQREYEAFQHVLRGKEVELYSATAQQAERFRKRIQAQNGYGPKNRKYPLILRNDCIRIEESPKSFHRWWLKLPVYPKSIWVPIQLPRNQETLLKLPLCESKLFPRNGTWYVNLTVETDIELKPTKLILPVDMGVRKLATAIIDGKPHFYGSRIRKVRGNYFRLRRSVGRGRIIKKWKHNERETVRHELHRISEEIVSHAKRTNSAIAIGDLKGIRSMNKGRSFNRRLSSQPFYLFKQLLTYKANWEGIPIIEVPEAYTSATCHHCGMRGQRVAGRFSCPNCGLAVDTDVNGAWNIAKRAHGILHETGGRFDRPQTLGTWEPSRSLDQAQRITPPSSG